MSKTKKIILSAILLALLIVLSRFLSLKTQFLVISFSFVPIMISAILLGPKYSLLIAGLGDLIGALLFPFGLYFPGFTLSAAITGLIYGLVIYIPTDKKISDLNFIIRLAISSMLVLGIVNILITPIWLHLLYGKAYLIVISSRVIAQVIMLPIQVTVIFTLYKFLKSVIEKYLK